jgi:hypothetical protein
MNHAHWIALAALSLSCKTSGGASSDAGTPALKRFAIVAQESALYVDPSNITTHANDSNPCTTSAAPCLTYQGMVSAHWGAFDPRVRSALGLHFLSGPSNDLDPVIFVPYYEMVANVEPVVVIQGPLDTNNQVATGTLSAIVLTARSDNKVPAQATFSTAVGIHQLVYDSTHPAYFWTSLDRGSNTWELTQPLAPYDAARAQPTKTAPVVIVNGDTFTSYNPVVVNAEKIAAQNDGMTGNILLYHVALGDEPGHLVTTGSSISLAESLVQGYWHAVNPSANTQSLCQNCEIVSPFYQDQGGRYPAIGYELYGGEVCNQYALGDFTLDGDFISRSNVSLQSGVVDNVYVASGSTVEAHGVVRATQGPVYGAGSFRCDGGCALYINANANQAATTFPLTGGIGIAGAPYAIDNQATPMPWYFRGSQGAALVTDMDKTIAAGGFGMGARGGCAYAFGATICNLGP